MKNARVHLFVGTAICAATILVFLVFWDRLPDMVALQIRFDGSMGNSLPKPMLAFGLPIVTAIVNIVRGVSLSNEENPAVISFYTVPAFAVIATLAAVFFGLR